MKYFMRALFLMLLVLVNVNACHASGSGLQDGFKLLICLYNEKNMTRCAEYVTCLEKNLRHPLIEKIHVLYDASCDDKKNYLFNYLKTRPVVITLISRRATYGDFFKIANEKYPNSKIIVSNGDIYFNETLVLLKDYDLTNKFLALTRWNIQKDGSLKLRHHTIAQDTWIFVTPIRKFENDAIMLGLKGCDPEIAYYAHQCGLEVLNPCLSLQCCHLHLSDIKHYKENQRIYKKQLNPLPSFSML